MKLSLQLNSVATLLGTLAISCLPSMQAQAADSGTLTIIAKVAKSTCAVVIGDTAGTGTSSYKAVNLGNLTQTQAGSTGLAGSLFGPTKEVFFSLKDPNDTNSECNISNSTGWTITTGKLTAAQVITNGTQTLLKNQVATTSGGTDAAVQLLTSAATPAPIVLKIDATTDLVTLANTAKSGSFKAQFARTVASAAPSLGVYNFNMPLSIVYK